MASPEQSLKVILDILPIAKKSAVIDQLLASGVDVTGYPALEKLILSIDNKPLTQNEIAAIKKELTVCFAQEQ